MTVGEHLTAELGVRSARNRASAETTLNVDPGAARPIVARDWPRLPSTVRRRHDCPRRGPDGDQGAGWLGVRQRLFRQFLQLDVERGRQRFAGHAVSPRKARLVRVLPLVRESETALAELPLDLAAASRTWTPGVPRICCVVALLQSSQPDLVTGDHSSAGLVDVLLCCLADDPDDGPGKIAGRGEHLASRMESAPGMARIFEPSGTSGASMRSTMAGTNALLPAAATSFAYAFALILTTLASRTAEVLAASSLTFDLSIPIRNTGRSTTIGAPSSPSSSPRSG